MRFALVATTLAAVISVPAAAYVLAPRMAPDQFVSAVRCVAYADAVSPQADLEAAKWRLNVEAARQSPEIAWRAHQEVNLIAREIALSSSPPEQLRAGCPSGQALV
jgi:hypothetical protein